MKGDFKPYKHREPCPVCGHWKAPVVCRYRGPIENPYCVQCFRVQEGCAKDRHGNPVAARDGMGWFHDLRRDPHSAPRPPVFTPRLAPVADPAIADLARECHENLSELEVSALADGLGLSAYALARLRVGWCRQYVDKATGEEVPVKAFSFPMRDAAGKVIGIRFRNHAKQKWSVRGSLNGLFIPAGRIPAGPLVVVEGPTETAAVMDLGFAVIGRPGNTSGRDLIVKFCRRMNPLRDVVILRNNDPKGSHAERLTLMGAESLAQDLLRHRAARSVKIIAPPTTKDARDWKAAGATKSVIEHIIRSAIPYKLATLLAPTVGQRVG